MSALTAVSAPPMPASGPFAVETWGLTKTFTGPPPEEQQSWADAVVAGIKRLLKPPATKTVLNNIDLSVGRGEFFGIIGSNGAGKTTFLKILNCILSLPMLEVAR